ncbi:nucleoside triphosphate pyrophosphatase [Thermosyntropha sp.]|uniref:Maf family protein n=1 Tax=Thermosyntropha sp. TaxID=2740820 RepID=UPI0025E95DED|nr:nucleoside triphosphate pyrophosphatase [Thermosyntropha sp.]MBO8158790.1 septum formation inhibitor Maf [Thermosyntropha sp.]
MPKIILASESPRRSELLRCIGIDFIKHPASVDEEFYSHENPEEVVKRLASNKAENVADQYSKGIVVAADTVVVLGRKILGKPADENEAHAMLSMLSGKKHQVITGVCVKDIGKNIKIVEAELTNVYFRTLEEEEIWYYIKTGEPMDKAGAYGIQGLGALLVEKIEGCYFNVVGLPLNRLNKMFKVLGLNILGGEGFGGV